jgi:hypothetical protein
MPKWSEVPWGTITTGVIAVYGAALGTFNLLLQRRRDRIAASDLRRAQAEQISAWHLPDDEEERSDGFLVPLVLQNKSSQPVFDVIASLVQIVNEGESRPEGSRFRALISRVPPGETKTRVLHPGRGMHFRASIELAFRDAAGNYWRRRGNGILQEVDQPPDKLYGLGRPLPWEQS